MQLFENWDPLRLPRGSVRALVTLVLLGTFWTLVLLGTEASPDAEGREIPPILGYLVLLIVGYYFGARSGPVREDVRGPLFLPRGTIRAIIIGGSCVAGYFSWSAGRLRLAAEDPSFIVLACAGALLLGFLIRKAADLISRGKASKPRRWFENVKSVLVLMATAVVALLSVFQLEDPGTDNFLLVAGAIVGFYFGSRHS